MSTIATVTLQCANNRWEVSFKKEEQILRYSYYITILVLRWSISRSQENVLKQFLTGFFI